GLLQAEARDLAYCLDDIDLLFAGSLQDDVELGLLLDRGGGGGTAGARGGHGHRRGGGRDAVVLLERLDAPRELQHRELVDLLDEILRRNCHALSLVLLDLLSFFQSSAGRVRRLRPVALSDRGSGRAPSPGSAARRPARGPGGSPATGAGRGASRSAPRG